MPADEIMRKFHKGTLRSSSGKKVTSLKQAKAIAASYAAKPGSAEEQRKALNNAQG